MCLTTIRKVLDPPDPKVRKGWKLVWKTSRGAYESLFYSVEGGWIDDDERIPKNKWLKATKISLRTLVGSDYLSGFHIYTAKPKPAFSEAVVPVFYRNLRTIGTQHDQVVHVADEVMYLSGDKHPPLAEAQRPPLVEEKRPVLEGTDTPKAKAKKGKR